MRPLSILDHPVFDAPLGPEKGFSEESILVAKRGRRCTMEKQLLGSNLAKKTRDFERSARRYGNEGGEMKLLQEYPDALQKYQKTVAAIRQRNQRGVWWRFFTTEEE